MIYSLRGFIKFLSSDFFVIECCGVGYKCICGSRFLEELRKRKENSEIEVFVYMSVRENAVDLFGFSDSDNLEFFKLLISVKNVGSRTALGLLSEFSPDEISSMVISGDHSDMVRAPGIGEKTAKRIILELKDKLSKTKFLNIQTASSRNVSEASRALVVLGYSRREVIPVLANLDPNMSIEELIRRSLQTLGSSKK
ncbi:MAG: Holliday junction branch migration protein RuvA [Oscillospiraceae bacterium]|jgi:Holliday junction DNA helicase RuvA|nr:Holliday junction branch migration protein RuvA [Oscillospiraceae bacterium]